MQAVQCGWRIKFSHGSRPYSSVVPSVHRADAAKCCKPCDRYRLLKR